MKQSEKIVFNPENAKPVLKWAGGKSQLIGKLLPLVPKSYGNYIEPFLGGGALFFSLNPKSAIIADSNPELINLYTVIANNVEALIKALKVHENNSEYFYKIKSRTLEGAFTRTSCCSYNLPK